MFKYLLLFLSTLFISCSTTEDQKRNIAGGDSNGISKEKYYAHRGQEESIHWTYDGYQSQWYLFGKAILKEDNRDFLKTGTKLRVNLMEDNLHDTGVDEMKEAMSDDGAHKEEAKGLAKTHADLTEKMMENNMISTGVDKPEQMIDCEKVMYMKRRTPDGSCYFYKHEKFMQPRDKKLAMDVLMGAKGQRFGRNAQQEYANKQSRKDIMEPNPFEISQRLFSREDGKTKEADVLNVLAAAWLQAMNHDWFTHGKNSKKRNLKVPGYAGHKHFNKASYDIPATRSESDKEKSVDKNGYKYTSRNQVTHWWDASQIYGSDQETINKVRSKWVNGVNTGEILPNGKIAVDTKNRKLIYDKNTKLPVTGFHDNWWLGLEMIHTLFHLEHNRIVDEILLPMVDNGKKVSSWKKRGKTRKHVGQKEKICVGLNEKACGDQIFEYARLINAALMAKIHTVEWTPALLNHPMLHIAMRSNWYGLRELIGGDSEKLRSLLPAHIRHVVSGLVGPENLDLYSTPFTLTEEFVAVYRMHPLVPESINYRSLTNPKAKPEEVPVENVVFRKAVGQVKSVNGMKDQNVKGSALNWMFSFGTSHPGGMMLHNYPTFMQNFVAERNTGPKHSDSFRMNMGAIDILRDRERNVPRYNDFRRSLGLPTIDSFEELFDPDPTDDNNDHLKTHAKDIATLKDIYNDDVEMLDLLVGSLAEKDRYPGYAFGNTPFWIFAIMASRRLMADPFFSDFYTEEVYTKDGLDYVQDTNMVDVVLNHFPELRSQFYKTVRRKRPSQRGSVVKTWQDVEVLKVKNAFRPWGHVYDKVHAKMTGKPLKSTEK